MNFCKKYNPKLNREDLDFLDRKGELLNSE